MSLADMPDMKRRHVARSVALSLALSIGFAPAVRAEEIRSAPPRLPETDHFTIDPVVDGVLVAGGITFSELLGLILSTGEIRPTQPGDPNVLLSIDRGAVTQTIDPNAGTRSTVGLYAAYGYAVLDPILSGVRDGRRALLVDAILYAESISLTQAFTNATKIGVRRPRPIDYAMCAPGSTSTNCNNTDLQLSFFSGHASGTGAISATATYLAFMRSGPRSARPWITLGVGTLLTAFVSYERVRSGEHFPTDVIMGSLAGAGIGVLVPHFHRRPHYHESEYCAPPVIVGFSAPSRDSAQMTLGFRF
jgi:membrane-associated phospholipid phosphatase